MKSYTQDHEKMRKFLAITGTPGTGKTSTSRLLEETVCWKHIDLGNLVLRRRLFRGYDRQRNVPIVDLRRTREHVLDATSRTKSRIVILDGSYSHLIFAGKHVLAVVVLRCSPSQLAKRLKRKRWSEQKIKENVQSEILGVCKSEALRNHKKVCDIDTTDKEVEEVCSNVIALYEKGFPKTRHIDWLTNLISDRSLLKWMV